MIWFSIAVVASLAILSYSINKKIYSPGTFLCLEWAAILLFYEFNEYGYYAVEQKTLYLITIGVSSFLIGTIIAKYSSKKARIGKRTRKGKPIVSDYSYNRQLIYILLVFSLLYCIWKIVSIGPMNLLQSQGFGMVRSNWLKGSGLTGAKDETVYNLFVLPSVYVNIVIAIINITLYHKDRPQLFLTLADVAMITLYTGGRMLIMDVLVMLLVALRLNQVKIKLQISRKRKLIITVAIIFAIVVLDRITHDRQGIGIVQVIMGNFSLSVPLLDYVVKAADAAHDITYGHIFFRGIVEIPLTFLALLGIDLWPSQYQTLSKYTTPFFRIAPSTSANAYVTSFFYFYLDARWIGVVLLSIIFGFLSQKIYKNALKDKTDKRMLQRDRSLYLVVAMAILRTFFNYSFSRSTYVMLIILIMLVFTRKRINAGR